MISSTIVLKMWCLCVSTSLVLSQVNFHKENCWILQKNFPLGRTYDILWIFPQRPSCLVPLRLFSGLKIHEILSNSIYVLLFFSPAISHNLMRCSARGPNNKEKVIHFFSRVKCVSTSDWENMRSHRCKEWMTESRHSSWNAAAHKLWVRTHIYHADAWLR